jgi:hypothetical protein
LLSPSSKSPPCVLFTIRPWRAVLINEGSFLRVYRTYEFFLKRPPSILGALLDAESSPHDTPLLPPSIQDLSYVGIFPLSSHFNTLVQNIPKLDRLFVQLVPRNAIPWDSREIRGLDVNDLWMERNIAYSVLMRALFDPAAGSPWLSLRDFESGDAVDKDAWMQCVQLSGIRGWKVDREGVFVRDVPVEDAVGGSSRSVSTLAGLALSAKLLMRRSHGRLSRLAFNGVARLPLSSMCSYLGHNAGQ